MAEMVGPARFERATLCLEGRCSIQLSYGPVSLFYQRKRNSKRQIIQFRRRGKLGCTRACFLWPNVRQSQTVYDIVFFIDA
jgi:hypothetical protein